MRASVLALLCFVCVAKEQNNVQSCWGDISNRTGYNATADLIEVQSASLKLHKGSKSNLIALAERKNHSVFDINMMTQLLEGKYHNMWLGEPLQKDAVALQMYTVLMQQLKPGTIFDLGTSGGGSALWFGSQAKALGLDSKVVTFDLHDYRSESSKQKMEALDNIVTVHGDLKDAVRVLGLEMIQGNHMPHPWLIVEDCHVDAKVIMDAFLGAGMEKGDYIVYEDTHPDLTSTKGDTWAREKLERTQEVMRGFGDAFAVDAGIQDMFGYNGATFINSVFTQVKSTPEQQSSMPFYSPPWDSTFKPKRFNYGTVLEAKPDTLLAVLKALYADGIVLVEDTPLGSPVGMHDLVRTINTPQGGEVWNSSVWDNGDWSDFRHVDAFTYTLPMRYGGAREGANAHPNYGGNVFLVPHTDNAYMKEPTGIKSMHMNSVEGYTMPTSLLVDSFYLLSQLSHEDLRVLMTEDVHHHWEAAGESDNTFQSIRKTIGTDTIGRLRITINKSTRNMTAPMSPELAAALDRLDALAEDPNNGLQVSMTEGLAVFVDNSRVLHGRMGGNLTARSLSGGDVSHFSTQKLWRQLLSTGLSV